ncbi:MULTISPECIES: NAD(P)H-dependent oxidoreductase [unclassified Mesorhizobium]|uniref:NAD(P)H-dependent oxidoreductase n=1 Tax=unclassified Mesorhizobium TaxID=325217 RepID=UPI00333AD4A0
MKVLVVHCHPCADSFSGAVRDTVLETLAESGHQVHLLDLYATGFDPVMRTQEWRGYHDKAANLQRPSPSITTPIAAPRATRWP